MRWLRRVVNLFRRDTIDRDIARELEFHLAERADELRMAGVPAAEAAREARLRFGNPSALADRVRDVELAGSLDALGRHVREASRSAWRAPGFALTVILTLAVGIGANSAVFTAMHAVLWRPLPVPAPDRLVRVQQVLDADTPIAPVRLRAWAERTTAFTALSGAYLEDVSDTTGPLPERARRAVVAPGYFDVWGVTPAIGRGFSAEEMTAGGPRAVLVSWRYWQTRLGGDPAAPGRVVRIEGRPHAVTGVMPPLFLYPDRAVDFWMPYPVDGPALAPTAVNRQAQWYVGIGRLADGVTVEQARADLTVIQSALGDEYPDTDRAVAVRVDPFAATVVGEIGGSLWLLYGAVSLLLAIACTNIAALLLARATSRSHDVALRLSLGATRGGVVAQMLTEVALLALAGAAVGLVLAHLATSAMVAWLPDLPRREEIGVDVGTFAYAAAAALVVAVLCGLVPALRATRAAAVLTPGSRGEVPGRQRLQWVLVGVQVTSSLVLLAGGGLLYRSVAALGQLAPGFDPGPVLALRMSGSWAETVQRGAVDQRIARALDALRAVPGVAAASTAWSLPGVPRRYETTFEVAGGRVDVGRGVLAEWRSVAPDYFGVLGIPILEGALCDPRPAGATVTQVMVNRTFAQRYLPDGRAVGARLQWEDATQSGRIVGIVGDAREAGLERQPPPVVYACDPAPTPFPWFLLRTRTAPAALADEVRVALREIDAGRSVYDVGPLAARIGGAYREPRARMLALLAFAAAALSLAGLGLYATVSYVAQRRRREVGLRLALGATRTRVVWQVAGEGWRVVIVAVAVGLGVALAGGRALSGMLFEVSPTDPSTLAAVAAAVTLVGLCAGAVPVVRAARIDPVRVLRDEP